jgi:hypothetical protein
MEFLCTEAEVMFEYEPTQDDELLLKVGMIIKNVKEVRDGGRGKK